MRGAFYLIMHHPPFAPSESRSVFYRGAKRTLGSSVIPAEARIQFSLSS